MTNDNGQTMSVYMAFQELPILTQQGVVISQPPGEADVDATSDDFRHLY
jgi:hypothetical protein